MVFHTRKGKKIILIVHFLLFVIPFFIYIYIFSIYIVITKIHTIKVHNILQICTTNYINLFLIQSLLIYTSYAQTVQ